MLITYLWRSYSPASLPDHCSKTLSSVSIPHPHHIGKSDPVISLAVSLLAVTISCPEEPEARQLAKRLPGSVTVQKLKGLLQRVYRVDTAQQRLSYLDRSRNIEIEMDDDLKQLSFYSVESGDTILLRW
jgi:hypothetical protein